MRFLQTTEDPRKPLDRFDTLIDLSAHTTATRRTAKPPTEDGKSIASATHSPSSRSPIPSRYLPSTPTPAPTSIAAPIAASGAALHLPIRAGSERSPHPDRGLRPDSFRRILSPPRVPVSKSKEGKGKPQAAGDDAGRGRGDGGGGELKVMALPSPTLPKLRTQSNLTLS